MFEKKLISGILIALFLISCKETPKQEKNKQNVSIEGTDKENNLLIGSWTEPIPGQEKEIQGIKINTDGTAKSINMSTLNYKKWWKKNDTLILVSESIGNHSSGIDTIEYKIITLNNKELVLKNRNYSIKYKRQ